MVVSRVQIMLVLTELPDRDIRKRSLLVLVNMTLKTVTQVVAGLVNSVNTPRTNVQLRMTKNGTLEKNV